MPTATEQNFVYVATGAEGVDFKIALPAPRVDNLYFVTASLGAVASPFTIDLPNASASDRTTTQFRVKASTAVAPGDRIEFHVYDPLATFFVDLRSYGVIPNVDDGASGGAIATANGNAISQAFADHPTNTMFVLPMGKIYVNRNLAGVGSDRLAALRMTSLSDVVLTGWGKGSTQLIMTGSQANGPSRIIAIFECNRVTIRDLTIAHGPNLSNIDASNLQNHHILIGSTAMTRNCTDVEVANVDHGQCIGDGIFVAGGGGASNNVINTRIHHVTMRTGGHPLSPRGGSRSCFHYISGVLNLELADFFLHGAKNSPIDGEPSGGRLDSINIHDGVVDNSGGSTPIAISFDGFDALNPLTNSRLSDVTVIEGQVQVIHTDNCTLDNVTIYASGKAGMAGASDPLLFVFQRNTGTKLRNLCVTRDAGSAAGGLVHIQNTVTTAHGRIEIEGGEWLTRVAPPGSGVAASCHVVLEDADRIGIRGTRIRVEEATPAGHIGIKLQNGIADITNVAIDDVVIESPNGFLLHGLYIGSQRGHALTGIAVRGLVATSAATNGVMYDAISGSPLENYPILQGCNLTGCTNPWNTANAAVGAVFPVLAGNKSTVCQLVGTAAPEGAVSAIQGSTYTKMSGDATQTWIKATGTGNTGWRRVASSSQTIAVPASAFRVALPASNFAIGSVPDTDGGIWGFGSSASGIIVAPVELPVGVRVRSIVWHLNKASQAAAMIMKLRKRIATTNTDLSTTTDTSAGAGWITNTAAAIDYTVEASASVWLHVTAGSAAHQFGWAEITYDLP